MSLYDVVEDSSPSACFSTDAERISSNMLIPLQNPLPTTEKIIGVGKLRYRSLVF